MRTVLVLISLCIVCCGLAMAAPGTASSSGSRVAGRQLDTVRLLVHERPEAVRLTLEDAADMPFAEPVTRFVVLPTTGSATQVRVSLDAEAIQAGLEAKAGPVMVARGLALLPVTISRMPGTSPEVPATVDVEIRSRDDADPRTSPALTHSLGFHEALRGLVPAQQLERIPVAGEGSYLIITHPDFEAALAPLLSWKTEKGLTASIVTTAVTGQTTTAIRNYIQNAYDTWPKPPQYVLLVGDSDRIPGFDIYGAISDHPYSMMEGDDFLPDLHVGRLSVQSAAETRTVVAKILRYEQSPFTDDGGAWMGRGLVVAANYASSTPVEVARYCREEMYGIGFSQVDSTFYPPFWTDRLNMIPRAINNGVSIVAYRGWAYGTLGWEPPHFTQSEIPSLTNAWKTPVVMSFVCQNNDFAVPECFGETWIRAGTESEPKGAVAFIGNSEPWSHTRFNDAAAIGCFRALGQQGIRKLGELIDAFKLEWIVQFPNEFHYGDATQESVEYYYHIYNLLGDPEMAIQAGVPAAIRVTHAGVLPIASNLVEVRVENATTGSPIAGARVGVSQSEALLGSDWTDAAGIARVRLTARDNGDPVKIAVTGEGILPYRGTATVGNTGSFLALAQATFDDDASGQSHGNGDGIANPGETVEILPTLRNAGGTPSTGVSATVSAIAGASVVAESTTFPDIPAGGQAFAQGPVVVRIDAGAEDGQLVRLQLSATASGVPPEGTSTSLYEVRVKAPSFVVQSTMLDGDGMLAPGETADLTVRLANDGSIESWPVTASLEVLTPEVLTVESGTAAYAAIGAGGTGDPASPFVIRAGEGVAQGRTAVMSLTLQGPEGATSTVSFSVTVGKAEYNTPLGPDAYGYYAIDQTDTDYPELTPTFSYRTISTVYGGAGTKLDLLDNEVEFIDLPFPFTFYGRTYDRAAISDNGWISFDLSNQFDFYNWHIPNTYGRGAVIAPFWDNLDPTKKVSQEDQRLVGDGVYTLHDAERHVFVVEWSRLANKIPEQDDLQTFQAILYDPSHYPTRTGDGKILFQYKQVTNNDVERMFSTVGIEDESEEIGLEYTYFNNYPAGAAPVSSGLAILITTDTPRYQPFDLAEFRAERTGRSIVLAWEAKDARPRSGTRILRGTLGGSYEVVSDLLPAEARSFEDTTADPDLTYSYKVVSLDPYGRETILGPYPYEGAQGGSTVCALEAKTPNPFRGTMELTYAVPRRAMVVLQIHDLAGRVVRTLASGRTEPGVRTALWDGRDDNGRDLPSGVYLASLAAGREKKTLKLTLLR